MSHHTIPPSLEKLMELDRKLEEARAGVPPLLQMPDFSELVTEPAEQLMCRFNLDLLYLKTKIVLHRRYMEKPFAQLTPEEQQIGIGSSRETCIDCALKVLGHHYTIYTASQPGGQLESVKWYMASISTHDFLLAAMIICLDLSQQLSNSASQSPSVALCPPPRAAMMDALEKSQKIWWDASGRKRLPGQHNTKDARPKRGDTFDETEKAGRAMAVMLEKIKARFPKHGNALAQPEAASTSMGTDAINQGFGIVPTPVYTSDGNAPTFGGVVSFHQWGDVNGVPEYLDYSNTTTYPSTSRESTSNQPAPPVPNELAPEYSMIGDMLDTQGAIDWQMFDSGLNANAQQFQWNENSTDNFPSAQKNGDIYDINSSGAINTMPLAGNAMLYGDTGPGSSSANGQYPGSWMSLQNMEDVNFDVGNYNDKEGFFYHLGETVGRTTYRQPK